MTTSPTITSSSNKYSIGELAYVCKRNQSQAHTFMIKAVKSSGLTQKELSRRTGIDEATISRTLSRPRNIEIDTISKLLYAATGEYLIITGLTKDKHLANKIIHEVKIGQSQDSGSQVFFYQIKLAAGSDSMSLDTGTSVIRIQENA